MCIRDRPKMFQLYIHKDQALTDNLIDRCKSSGFKSLCLTVDTVVAGNRERDHRWGFTTPPKLTLKSLMSFITHPKWTFNYLTHEKFELANVSHFTKKGSSIAKGVMEYINEQYDPAMSWKDAEYVVKKWGGPFALSAGGQKGVEMILQRMKEELRRDMILLGKKNIGDLSKENLAFRD